MTSSSEAYAGDPGRAKRRWYRAGALIAVLITAALGLTATAGPAAAFNYTRISGAGSTWSQNALDQWRRNVTQYGMTIDYAGTGSSDGRNQFRRGTVDFAASEIPYAVKDGRSVDPAPTRGYAYMPDTAGGTTFMYNLKIGASRVTNLRLSSASVAGIFTGTITRWNDPKIAKDNPGLSLPAIKVVPVVRSDGSGATAQFTQWLIATQGASWRAYCAKVGRSPCTQTSVYPTVPGAGFVSQNGSLGTTGYVTQPQSVGAITYDEYSYAIQAGFPIAKVLNRAGYYTEPTPGHVSVSLLKAKVDTIHTTDPARYLTQDLSQVYVNTDPRTYPLSSYSYLILPTKVENGFTAQKGRTLSDFGDYLLCQGQQQADPLGYSPLPQNLVQAGFNQLRKIPGANVPSINLAKCNNPTFSPSGVNVLALHDPKPPACDKAGPTQCTTGTGGSKQVSTPVKQSARGAGDGRSSSGSGGSGTGNVNAANNNPAVVNNGTGGSSNAAKVPGSNITNNAAVQAACDPDSGDCAAVNGSGNLADGTQIAGTPTSTSTSLGDGMQVALMALAGVLLLGLALAPPLIAQAGNRRRGRAANPTDPGARA